MASESIPLNFIGGPLNLVCRYENSKTVDDTIKLNQSADVLIYDGNGYTRPSVADAFKSRKYSVTTKQNDSDDQRFSTGTTNLDELLELTPIIRKPVRNLSLGVNILSID